MKAPWTDENAWAEEDHGDFWGAPRNVSLNV